MTPPTIPLLPARVRKPFAAVGRPFSAGASRVRGAVSSGAGRVAGAGRAYRGRLGAIPWPALAAAVFGVLYFGWAGYNTAARGADAGLGVLVSWPTLLAAAAVAATPVVGVVILTQRVREWRRPPQSLAELKVETITDITFPS